MGEDNRFDQNFIQYAYRKDHNTTSCGGISGRRGRGSPKPYIYLPNLIANDKRPSKLIREQQASELEKVTGLKYTPPLTATKYTHQELVQRRWG